MKRKNAVPTTLASTTVTQSRVSIFAPSRTKQGKRTVRVENKWGMAEVTGDLTQIHRSIVDLLVARDGWARRRNEDGSLDVAFAPHAMLRALGYAHPGANDAKWLETMIEDLRITRFRATVKRGEIDLTTNTGIVERHGPARDSVGRYIGYGVRLSPDYMSYYEADMPCHTESLTDHLVAVKSGAVQAIVRFLLSHQGGYRSSLDDVFAIVGIAGHDRRKRARADLRAHADHLRREFSVEVDLVAGTIAYTRRAEVWFGNPKPARQKALKSA